LSISLATLAAFAGRREGFRAVAKLKTHAKLVENLAVDLIRRHQHLQCPDVLRWVRGQMRIVVDPGITSEGLSGDGLAAHQIGEELAGFDRLRRRRHGQTEFYRGNHYPMKAHGRTRTFKNEMSGYVPGSPRQGFWPKTAETLAFTTMDRARLSGNRNARKPARRRGDAPVLRDPGVALDHRVLHFDGATHGSTTLRNSTMLPSPVRLTTRT
jgi:hypothetical protein